MGLAQTEICLRTLRLQPQRRSVRIATLLHPVRAAEQRAEVLIRADCNLSLRIEGDRFAPGGFGGGLVAELLLAITRARPRVRVRRTQRTRPTVRGRRLIPTACLGEAITEAQPVLAVFGAEGAGVV